MLQSKLFSKTQKSDPKDEAAKNAKLLIRAGFVHKEMSGVYSFLPLGLKVLNKLKNIVSQEMERVGGQEMLMTTLQDPEVWKSSGRWADEDSEEGGLPWFKTSLSNGSQLGIATTHEEPLARIMSHHINSYKDLPVLAFQFQEKFRNELRAKSGLMRGREFLMKDMYSFSISQDDLDVIYEQVAQAYMQVFNRVGLGQLTYRTFASGGAFSRFSDEFQTISDAGEDIIYIDEDKKLAVNKEIHNDGVLNDLGFDKNNLVEEKAIEVGNIFKLGIKYAESQNLYFEDRQGQKNPVVMGSYGIGIGRLMGAIAEIFSDEKGLVWPKEVSPFDVHLVAISEKGETLDQAEEAYKQLQAKGFEVLFDDRDCSAGKKLADSDLLGITQRVIISDKSIENGGVEVKQRNESESKIISVESFLQANI